VQARDALGVLGAGAAHWTFVSSCSVYADHSVPGADEGAALLKPLPEGEAGTPETYGESKSAIEQLTLGHVGDKAHVVRAGLIGGPGDVSDRYGYWPARFAAATTDPVLVPDIPGDATQIIDVRDLAAWIIQGTETGLTGAYNALGDVVPFGDYLAESQRVARATTDRGAQAYGRVQAESGMQEEPVRAVPEWLHAQGVQYWAGPDSLPLWLPPGYEGHARRSNRAARQRGLSLRPWQETLLATLEDERQRGLVRERRAGLGRATERRLVALWRGQQR
jgi:nucleoside-diphosphate-sugar epimerase